MLREDVYLTNQANQWAGKRKGVLIAKLAPKKKGCQNPGCGEKRHKHLQFAHIKETAISRTGPRGRKEKWADINANPQAYKVMCNRHALTNKATREHDRKMRKKGRANKHK
jgi:hypothetical protein